MFKQYIKKLFVIFWMVFLNKCWYIFLNICSWKLYIFKHKLHEFVRQWYFYLLYSPYLCLTSPPRTKVTSSSSKMKKACSVCSTCIRNSKYVPIWKVHINIYIYNVNYAVARRLHTRAPKMERLELVLGEDLLGEDSPDRGGTGDSSSSLRHVRKWKQKASARGGILAEVNSIRLSLWWSSWKSLLRQLWAAR